ncbi:glycosyltransferase family 1 protein, partial [Streptomyces sp. ME03-5709C]|nr:glycosyltransferase family 1 protein [Streptomyces sp. ME03-5709C]
GAPGGTAPLRTQTLPARLGAPAQGGVPVNRHHANGTMTRPHLHPHPVCRTRTGLTPPQAMHLGMPVVALATTEAVEAVTPGTVSTRPEVLAAAARHYLHEPAAAAEDGARARQAALRRYGLKRFLHDWERLLKEVCP